MIKRRDYIITICIFLAGFMFMTFMHEQTHIQIAEHHNLKWEWWTDWSSIGILSEECPTPECTLAHRNSDSFFYPLIAFYVAIGLLYINHISMGGITK